MDTFPGIFHATHQGDHAMTLQTPGPLAYEFRRYLERPSCPRCGDTLVAAESSVLVERGHIRHAWSCDGCGYDFETAIRLAVPDAGTIEEDFVSA